MEQIRVLLIEDNPGDALITKEMLAGNGGAFFDVAWEDSLSKGLKRITEGFDLVLLDLMLPDSKGLNTFLKLQQQAPQMPIIITTGLADESLAIRAVRSGAQDYFVKGYIDGDCLVHTMRYAIARKLGNPKVFTHEELKAFDGKEGRQSYVAFKGKVYDASDSTLWKNGSHGQVHVAGHDLTDELAEAPHGEEVFLRLPVVGEVAMPESFKQKLLSKAEALHFHSMLVHFPIAYSITAALFLILYLYSGERTAETASYYMLVLGSLSTPFAGITGLFSWKTTYHGEASRIFVVKKYLTALMVIIIWIACLWRTFTPELMTAAQGPDYLYMLLVMSLTPIAAVLGHYGGKLVYP